MTRRAVGVDGTRDGWVAVALDDERVAEVVVVDHIADVTARFGAVPTGVDIPIGLPDVPRREADHAARVQLAGASSSVFPAPCRAVVDGWRDGTLTDHAAASACSRAATGAGLTRQTWNIVPKIAEVDAHVAAGADLYEVHPELAFRLLAGRSLARKRTWNGVASRLALLAAVGVTLPPDVPGGDRLPPDDVLDAAVVAWTAAGAHLPGGLRPHPARPTQTAHGRPVAIWTRR